MKTLDELNREQRQRSRQDAMVAWAIAIVGMTACVVFSALAAWLWN